MTQLEIKKLTKDEFIYWSDWIGMRWPSIKNESGSIKSLYNDFSIYNDDILGQAAVEQLDEGNDFFSWPKLKRRCKEIYNDQLKEKVNAARSLEHKKELLKDKPSSFQSYLKANGWSSTDEAIFYTRVRLYKQKKLFHWDMPNMEKYVDMDYKTAKDNGWKQGLIAMEDK